MSENNMYEILEKPRLPFKKQFYEKIVAKGKIFRFRYIRTVLIFALLLMIVLFALLLPIKILFFLW